MALSDVLTKLKNQRTAIVTAINSKGGSLGADATLADCATAIGNISVGSAFYKCSALVAASEGGVQGQTLRMQGTDSIGGGSQDITFALEDATKTGKSRTWKSSDGEYRLLNKLDEDQDSGEYIWYIIHKFPGGEIVNSWTSINCQGSTSNDPWDMTEMMYNGDGMSYALTWTVSEASEATPATWSGYKATQGDDGKYSYAKTATTGLSYEGGFTPQVGIIYSQDAKVKVAQLMEATAAIPQDGLVFWMPFDGSTEARLGSVAPARDDYTGNITYETSAGITYANVSNMLYKAELGDTITTAWTFIMYIKIGADCANGSIIEWYGKTGYPAQDWSYQNGNIAPGNFSPGTKFHFYCMRVTVGVPSMTVTYDSETKTVALGSTSAILNGVYIGGNSAMPKLSGSIFDVAVYDRILTDEEVTALYQRVIPLQS